MPNKPWDLLERKNKAVSSGLKSSLEANNSPNLDWYFMLFIGIVGVIGASLAGVMHFWYLDNAFVCVTQGKIDSLFGASMALASLSAGFMIRGVIDAKR